MSHSVTHVTLNYWPEKLRINYVIVIVIGLSGNRSFSVHLCFFCPSFRIYVYFQSVFSIPQKHATGTSENWLKIHIYRWNADSELWKFWIMKIDWKYTYCLRPLYTYTPGRPKVSCEIKLVRFAILHAIFVQDRNIFKVIWWSWPCADWNRVFLRRRDTCSPGCGARAGGSQVFSGARGWCCERGDFSASRSSRRSSSACYWTPGPQQTEQTSEF